MGCPCKKVHSTIYCTNDGTPLHVSHKEKESALLAAKKQSKKCSQCEGREFRLEQ